MKASSGSWIRIYSCRLSGGIKDQRSGRWPRQVLQRPALLSRHTVTINNSAGVLLTPSMERRVQEVELAACTQCSQ
ncbi:unnamed protein product [Leptidea sinapis]|uniref:Uncharacterized protein n=1 Tax=Leptidea sinapis TaxID=189913 RepID=A0A5E4PTL1_9NEOP|nr:unnamed protein product [Leptidea sinapis]